jgi:hypothetical protein
MSGTPPSARAGFGETACAVDVDVVIDLIGKPCLSIEGG